MTKRFCILITTLLLLAVPKSWAQELEPFIFMPQWTAQAQFAGYYVALEKGFYAEEGLDVRIEHPSETLPVYERLRNGTCDATTLQLVQAMELMDTDVQLVNILQTSMENGLVIVSRHGQDPMTLRGARVSTWRVGFDQIAECMSAERKLDYEWVQAADFLNLFIAGAVDAALAMSYNEYYQILQTGLLEPGKGVFRFSENGFDIQEDGIYMTRENYGKNPGRAQRFAQASRKGWEWTAENPDEALDIVMKYTARGYIATNRILQKLMLDEILRLQLAKDSGEREFRLRPEMVEAASELMYKNGMLRRKIAMEDLLP